MGYWYPAAAANWPIYFLKGPRACLSINRWLDVRRVWLKQMQGLETICSSETWRQVLAAPSTGPSSRLMSHFSFGPCVCFNINIQSVTPDWICEVQSWKRTFERGRPSWKTQQLIGWSLSQAPPQVFFVLIKLWSFDEAEKILKMWKRHVGRWQTAFTLLQLI